MKSTEPMARNTDPSTSHTAASRAKELQADHHLRILGALLTWGPMGKDGIGARCGLVGHQVSRRLVELQRLGQIFLTGRTVLSDADRPEREWTAVKPMTAAGEIQQPSQPVAPIQWATLLKETT